MDRTIFLPQSLEEADAFRKCGRWEEAIERYIASERILPKYAAIKHNIALCYFALNDAENALLYADLAIGVNTGLWQSRLLKAKSLNRLGKKEQAAFLLESLVKEYPNCAEARLELASLALDEFGDAMRAKQLVQSLAANPRHAKSACLTKLMASLYEPQESAEELSEGLRNFAREHLDGAKLVLQVMPHRTSVRRRIGLISPQFCCSPVYFFCIGALKHIARDFDLVFLDRGHRNDWATNEFKSIALEWLNLAGLDKDRLTSVIAGQGFDVLIDMGGWMDPVAMSALAGKPVKRIYKWVGGQSATTGIAAFDGFFTDRFQSLPEHQHLYTEPLIFLERGYVTYTPPSYLPEPAVADASRVLGVIANPVKISQAFLMHLKSSLVTYLEQEAEDISLRFIDRRYHHAKLRSRIASALQADRIGKRGRVHLNFIVPEGHRHYLEEVGKLTALVDTFPYTGGLTTIEALSLGVPCITKAGTLFNERHSHSHCSYAGTEGASFSLEQNFTEIFHLCQQNQGKDGRRSSLINASSSRLNHQELAEALVQYF